MKCECALCGDGCEECETGSHRYENWLDAEDIMARYVIFRLWRLEISWWKPTKISFKKRR